MSEIVLNNCRLCQNRNGLIEFINNVEFINQVFLCTNIKLNDEMVNNLPKTICNECKINIETFFKYIEEVRKVDEFLRNYIKENSKQSHLPTVDNTTLKTTNKQYKCTNCSKSYVRINNLKNHQLIHNKLYCTKCKTLFDIDIALKEHNCHEKVNCIVKEVDTVNETNLDSLNSEQHELLEEDLLTKFEQQIVEDVTNKSINDLQWNGKEVIKDSYMCKWPNCNKIYSTSYTLKTHEMKHEGKRRFLCVTCGKGFLTKNSLTCHEKIHLEVKGYTCKLCNIGFSVRSNLRAHEKKHHEGIRFYCSQCTRVFISKCSLERHEKLHTGIKEFQCSNCPSAFYTNKELTKHQRYHQGLRQYKCSVCFKTFFEKHHLVIHMRSHTGERPYVCKILGCGKSFTESQKLTRHLKARHPPV